MKQVKLANLSWKQAEIAFQEKPVILIPVGSTEAHGPHLPLGADSMVAEETAIRAAAQAPALVVPTIWYGYAAMWRNFAGTISTSSNTVETLATDVIRALLPYGLRRFIFVNNHSANEAPLEVVARRFREEEGLVIAHYYPWRVMAHFYGQLFDNYAALAGHGAEPNTSVLMYLYPDDVDMSLAVADKVGKFGDFQMVNGRRVDFAGAPFELFVDMDEINPSGVTSGDPFPATAERGQLLMEKTAGALAEFIHAFRDMD